MVRTIMYGRILFVILFLLPGSSSSDWLEGGYVGPIDRSEVLPYFSDPIFYMSIPSGSQSYSYYNYPRPDVIRLGKYPYSGSWATYPRVPYLPSDEPRGSEFRQNSLAAMQWTPFQKNWTQTVSYAQKYSSFRVNKGGEWRMP